MIDSPDFCDKFQQVLVHHSQLLAESSERRALLQASLSLQQFIRDTEEATDWIEEKSKVASDESYRVSTYISVIPGLVLDYGFLCVWVQDPSSLEGKLQQHQAFEAELQANRWRIDGVVEAGHELTSAEHSASDTIQ